MKGDFTRFGFDSSKHFSRVLQQQGRVALDADANEASAIVLHHLRMLTRDLFGAAGGPPDSGFSIALDATASPALMWIGPGHYYVGGILCENENWVEYASQPDYAPAPPDANGGGGDALLAWLRSPSAAQKFWVYLDVWERHVSWVEDDSIRESALGGPDTCSRAKVVWQVKAAPWNPDWGDVGENQGNPCILPLPAFELPPTARLSARVDPGPAAPDPCSIAPGASYRGAENQLYRVEIQTGGDASTATFKWSRDNGSVETPWLGAGSSANALLVASSRGFAAGDWVELLDDALELAGLPGPLLRVAAVAGDELDLDAASIPATGLPAWSAALGNPRARRWDQTTNDTIGLVDGAVPITESDPTQPIWIDLEDGVQVSFGTGGQYRCGDYWVLAARVATQGVLWPLDATGQPAREPPLGIAHAYAPLGVLTFSAAGGIGVTLCRNCITTSAVVCDVASAPPMRASASASKSVKAQTVPVQGAASAGGPAAKSSKGVAAGARRRRTP